MDQGVIKSLKTRVKVTELFRALIKIISLSTVLILVAMNTFLSSWNVALTNGINNCFGKAEIKILNQELTQTDAGSPFQMSLIQLNMKCQLTNS